MKCLWKVAAFFLVVSCVFSLLSSQRVNPLAVWMQSRALCFLRQVELYSTDLHIFHSIEWPSQIIKCPFISWQGLGSKANTEGPVEGGLSLTLRHCGWQPSNTAPEPTAVKMEKCSKAAKMLVSIHNPCFRGINSFSVNDGTISPFNNIPTVFTEFKIFQQLLFRSFFTNYLLGYLRRNVCLYIQFQHPYQDNSNLNDPMIHGAFYTVKCWHNV